MSLSPAEENSAAPERRGGVRRTASERSEGKFAADLNDAGGRRVRDLSRCRIAHAVIDGGSAARSTADQGAGTDCILVVIPGVEKVARNPEVHVLSDREV